MITFKSKKMIALSGVCALLLTGCFPTGSQHLSNEDNGVISKQIEEIVSDNKQLEVEAEIDENAREIPKVNVKIMSWDEEKIKEVFLTGKTDLEHEERSAVYDEFFPNYKSHLYSQGDDDYWLTYEPGRLSSKNRSNNVFGYNTLAANYKFYCFKDYFSDESISVLPKEEAVNRCTQLMNEVGITNYSEPEIYAITVDKANEFWKSEGYDEYEEYKDWMSPEDEIYILSFPIEYNDIPVTLFSPESIRNDHVGIFAGSFVFFLVTKDEILYLDSNNLFSPQYENGEYVTIKCSAENALKIALDYYNGIKLDEGKSVKVTQCKLVYAPRKWHEQGEIITLTPLWEIDTVQYTQGNLMGVKNSLHIDAQTGDIIIW